MLVSLYVFFIKRFSQVKDNRIVFQGKPDYSDNPRALSDYLLAKGYADNYELFWVVKNIKKVKREHPNIPIRFISARFKFGLPRFFTYYYLLTAKYQFCSHSFIIPLSKKQSGQFYIALWHGCGYKANSANRRLRFFDKAIVPGQLFLKTKAIFWNTSEDYLLPIGYPRYNWLLYPSAKATEMMNWFRRTAKHVVIWMPTFRNSNTNIKYGENSIKQFPLIKNVADWNTIDDICGQLGVTLLVKLHMSQKQYCINFSDYNNIHQITNDDFEKANVQLYEFISLTDVLITDYSSIAIDYLLLNKPIAFTLDDYEIYEQVRGFVFDNAKDFMPGHHLYNIDDLITFLRDVAAQKDRYAREREKMKQIAIFKCEDYCKQLISNIGL